MLNCTWRIAAITLLAAGSLFAAVADVSYSSSSVTIDIRGGGSSASLRVTGPLEFVWEESLDSGTVTINVVDLPVDGTYNWELVVNPRAPQVVPGEVNGRTVALSQAALVANGPRGRNNVLSGSFQVSGGSIVVPGLQEGPGQSPGQTPGPPSN